MAGLTAGTGLIVTLLGSRDVRGIRLLEDLGVVPDRFIRHNERKAFEFIRNYAIQYQHLPSIELVEVSTETDFPRAVPPDALQFWAEELIKESSLYFVAGKMMEMKKALSKGNVDLVKQLVGELYFGTENQLGKNVSVSLLDATLKAIEEHDTAQQRGTAVVGVPFGWDYLDTVTGGAHGGDCIVLVSRPGVGKSFVMAQWAVNAYMEGHKILFFPMEMTAPHMARRMLAIGAGVSPTALKLGDMSAFGMREVRAFVESVLDARPSDDFMLAPGDLHMTTESVLVKAMASRPDIIYIDGAYLLEPSDRRTNRAGWENVEQVTKELKRIALSLKIPIILSHQFNREGPKAGISGISRSDAIGQIASIVFGLDTEETAASMEIGGVDYRLLKLLKGRDGETGLLRILYDMRRAVIREDEVIQGAFDEQSDHDDSIATF